MKRGGALLLFGGGVVTIGGVLLAWRRSVKTTDDIKKAISGVVDISTPVGDRGKVNVRATGYWPYTARPDEQKMEGGTNDRKGKPIITLEQHQSDPARYPYVSVSGDPSIWPYGQRVSIDAWPTSIFRVVDTGSHFHGASKVYRVVGYEPLDIAVQSSSTTVPKLVVATIYPGDNFEGGKAVVTSGFKDQTVLSGVVEARTAQDIEALARAVESELGGQKREEQYAAAWAMRNRAAETDVTVYQLLAPKGVYGSVAKSGGYASTRKAPTERATDVATQVLDADQSADPTDGAIEFWTPELQTQLHELAGVHRAAVRLGDAARAKKYAKYANYGSEGDVRVRQAKNGLRVTTVVGAVELLKKVT